MKTGWLAKAGSFSVEHVPCPRPGQPVDLTHPPLGLLHTTEGATIEGALSVFRQHYAPHFTVGRDAKGRVRILQHVPLGEMAAALENHPGGVETNREVRVQIEIVGHCSKSKWLPEPGTRAALSALLATLHDAAGIPLKHPGVARSSTKWAKATGWVGHVDAPENVHYDPGALDYAGMFAATGRALLVATPKTGKRPKKAVPVVSKKAALKRRAKKAAPHPLCKACKEHAQVSTPTSSSANAKVTVKVTGNTTSSSAAKRKPAKAKAAPKKPAAKKPTAKKKPAARRQSSASRRRPA